MRNYHFLFFEQNHEKKVEEIFYMIPRNVIVLPKETYSFCPVGYKRYNPLTNFQIEIYNWRAFIFPQRD